LFVFIAESLKQSFIIVPLVHTAVSEFAAHIYTRYVLSSLLQCDRIIGPHAGLINVSSVCIRSSSYYCLVRHSYGKSFDENFHNYLTGHTFVLHIQCICLPVYSSWN
jgi:hypothetical protein